MYCTMYYGARTRADGTCLVAVLHMRLASSGVGGAQWVRLALWYVDVGRG